MAGCPYETRDEAEAPSQLPVGEAGMAVVGQCFGGGGTRVHGDPGPKAAHLHVLPHPWWKRALKAAIKSTMSTSKLKNHLFKRIYKGNRWKTIPKHDVRVYFQLEKGKADCGASCQRRR